MTICNCFDDSHTKDEVIGVAPLIDGLYYLQLAPFVNTKVIVED